MSIYILTFLEFFKIGLFSIGGGLATLPFLNNLITKYNWFTNSDLINMLAISESTPGPIGINMSTYVGFHVAGILGSLISTFALVLPSYIIIITISHFMNKFKDNQYVNNTFSLIKPVVTGLISISLYEMYKVTLLGGIETLTLNIKNFVLFLILLGLIIKIKKHPVVYIIIGGILGYLFKL